MNDGKAGIYNNGYVFEIAGPREYFNIRTKLHSLIKRQYKDQILDYYDDPDDDLYFERVVDFLSHLVIAIAGKPVSSR